MKPIRLNLGLIVENKDNTESIIKIYGTVSEGISPFKSCCFNFPTYQTVKSCIPITTNITKTP